MPEGQEQGKYREHRAHLKGDFVLLENEVKNGILTHYSLSLIEYCANDQEFGELMRKLRVKAGMLYLKSKQIPSKGPESVTEWLNRSRHGRGRLKTKCGPNKHGAEDERVGP